MIEIVILIEDIIIIINKMYNNLVHFINLFVTMSFLVRSVSKSLLYRSSLTSLSSTIGKRFFATEAEEKEVWDYFLLIRIRIELKCKKWWLKSWKKKLEPQSLILKIFLMMLDFCILLVNAIMNRLEMTVVSPKFKGMKLLQQHRMLNKV